MAIRIYEEGQHPSGFIGIRVTRSFAGQYRQAYFSFRDKGRMLNVKERQALMKKAQQLEAEWKLESEEHKYQSRLTAAHPNTKPHRSVGVEGITAEFAVDNSGDSRSYYYPGFRVSRPGPGSRAATHVRFSQYGFEGAWDQAVELWAERYGIRPRDKKQVMANRPTREQFAALRKQMNKEGHDIPPEAMETVMADSRVRKTSKQAAPTSRVSKSPTAKKKRAVTSKAGGVVKRASPAKSASSKSTQR